MLKCIIFLEKYEQIYKRELMFKDVFFFYKYLKENVFTKKKKNKG